MLRIDSLSLLLPSNDVGLNKGLFRRHTETNEDGVILSDGLKLQVKGVPGLAWVTENKINGTVRIDLSSKILKDQYFDMINQNTVERLVHELNQTDVLRVSNEAVISRGGVVKMDVTQNLKPSGSLTSIVSGLSCLPITDKYNITGYKGPGNLGVAIVGKQKTIRERFISYDKYKNVLRDKGLQKLVPLNKLLSQFTDILRVETNLSSFKTIRDYTGCNAIAGEAPLLNQILTSTHIPTLEVFNKITKRVGTIDLELFQEWQDQPLYLIEKIEGRKQIIRALNYDMVAITAFIRDKVKGNVSQYIRNYRQLLNRLNKTEGRVDGFTLLDQLRNLMLAA